MLFWGQISRVSLLDGEEDDEERRLTTSSHVTYCLAGDEEGAGNEKEGGGEPPAGPSAPPSASAYTTCCHAPTTAFYAILGLSRCWWQYTVTSSPAPKRHNVTADAMEEGVATETRGGSDRPEVTGVGWSLPCSLSSLLAMNCRARAEELARRLQSRVKVSTGGTLALEQTSLVSPTSEGPYASIECRHSSLDDPNLDSLAEHDLRPIHVVTSEPTLHLQLPSPPPTLGNLPPEQDSDVYYDFDLSSPDEVPEEEEEGEEKEERENIDEKTRPFVSGERPESGCVTSVTSPLMFDDEGDEDGEGNDNHLGVSRDLYPSQESVLCSPDANLRAVRQILSSSSLTDNYTTSGESDVCPSTACERFSQITTTGGDSEEISVSDKKSDSAVASSCELDHGWGETHPGSDSVPAEGVSECVDKWQCRSGQVSMPVANSGSCWCHTTRGTEPARHLPTSPDRHSDTSEPGYSGNSDSVLKVSKDERSSKDEYNVSVMTEDEDQENIKEDRRSTSWGEKEEERLSRGRKVDAGITYPHSKDDDDLGCDLSSSGSDAKDHHSPDEEVNILRSAVKVAPVVPQSISGTTPPLVEPHLYAPSEGQPAVMEARAGSEGDLYGKDEVFCADSDNEVIETLGADEEGSEEEEENEEDIEEEVILTGKFRNFRGYTERVRRLSDEVEDRPPPPVIIHDVDGGVSEALEPAKSIDLADEDDQLSSSDLASQLSRLDVEDAASEEGGGEGEEEEEEEEDDENLPGESRSSSEETDPARIEDFKMRIKRSSSLKCGKTPPGTPGRKKIVRFADMLGLDLAAVRTFLAGVPHVPRSAFWDLEVEREAAAAKAAAASSATSAGGAPTCIPRRVLTPLFQQPGSQPNFMDRVRQHKVVVENVVIGEDMSVRGVVRVLSIDFHKCVSVRYTFDQWRNFHEATATYVPGSFDGATDRFSFLLWGSFLQDNGALAFCVRYCTLGQEFWDNNFGRNYSLQCYSSMGPVGGAGDVGSVRPQNSSSVQQQFMGQGGQSASAAQVYNSFGSPVTPNDPWVTRFF